MKTFSKGLFSRFFPKNGPPGGGAFYQISPDVARNYLHTTLLKMYPKSNFFDSGSMVFQFGVPKKGGVLTKTCSRG